MNTFGETVRQLRTAQDLGLREAAVQVGISPAYLSRIERGKEKPPSAEVIKAIARVLAADPDVLFRLSASTDPELTSFLHSNDEAMKLVRLVSESSFSSDELQQLIELAERLHSERTRRK